LLEAAHRLIRQHRAQPGDVRRVGDPEQTQGRRQLRKRRDPPAIAGPHGEVDQGLAHGHDIDRALAVLRDHRVKVDQMGDPIRDPVGRGRDDQSGVAVSHEDHLGEVFLDDQVHDVVDVRVKPHLGAEQMRLVAVTGQRGRDHPMPGRRQQRDHPLPALSTVPGTVYQQKC
jgi:hypothetical protein